VAISDPATAHFTAIKNLGDTSIAYKPRHTHTHTHPETLEAREKNRWQLVTHCSINLIIKISRIRRSGLFQFRIISETTNPIRISRALWMEEVPSAMPVPTEDNKTRKKTAMY
jgi:hypothetical protein